MSTGELSNVISGECRRNTIVNLKHVNELPLRNALETFDRNGDGKIDITELQKIMYWYGLWKYASIGLCLVITLLVWSIFGLTIWAINLTKDYTVTGGVMTGAEEVVKMSVANTFIPLSWASLLDRRHLDALDSLTIEVAQGIGKFSAGVYHVKVASYVHANSTYIKLFGEDGSRVWVNSGTVVLHHPDADEAVMVCGAAACNTLAVDVKPEYLQQLVQRSATLFQSNRDFKLPSTVDGVAISKAAGEDVTCMAGQFPYDIDLFNYKGRAISDNIEDKDLILEQDKRQRKAAEPKHINNYMKSEWIMQGDERAKTLTRLNKFNSNVFGGRVDEEGSMKEIHSPTLGYEHYEVHDMDFYPRNPALAHPQQLNAHHEVKQTVEGIKINLHDRGSATDELTRFFARSLRSLFPDLHAAASMFEIFMYVSSPAARSQLMQANSHDIGLAIEEAEPAQAEVAGANIVDRIRVTSAFDPKAIDKILEGDASQKFVVGAGEFGSGVTQAMTGVLTNGQKSMKVPMKSLD